MKVYAVMKYFSEEYHLFEIYVNRDEAQKEVDKDLMHFDYIEERELRGLP